MNAKQKSKLPTWLPFVVGFLFVCLFASLGAWQINRGLDKRAERQLFEDETGFSAWHDGIPVRPYQQVRATGRFDADRQVLIENIVVGGRYGYYVITPLLGMDDEPVLLVNRGWLPLPPDRSALPEIPTDGAARTIRGRLNGVRSEGPRLGPPDRLDPDRWPQLVTYLDPEPLSELYDTRLPPWLVQLDADRAIVLDQDAADMGRHGFIHRNPYYGAKASLTNTLFDALKQIRSFKFLDHDVRVACDTEGMGFDHFHTREERIHIGSNDLLQPDEIMVVGNGAILAYTA